MLVLMVICMKYFTLTTILVKKYVNTVK